MKKLSLILFLFPLCLNVFAQDSKYSSFETYRKRAWKNISETQLIAAETMADLNSGFPASWIKEYLSTELRVTYKGENIIATGINDTFSKEQKNLLAQLDFGTSIDAKVEHKHTKDIKAIQFSVRYSPPVEAEYTGGEEAFQLYMRRVVCQIPEREMPKIEPGTMGMPIIAGFNFTIHEDGSIHNVQLTEPIGDEKLDQLLIQTVQNMPKWKPAQNAKGENVKQFFEFEVGFDWRC